MSTTMSTTTSTTPPITTPGRDLLPHAPAAPLPVLLAVVVVAALAARVVVGERPGLGAAVLALAVAAAVVVTRRAARSSVGLGSRRSGWQLVHGSAAVLLASSAALRDAGWLVTLDLFAALLLGAPALAPASAQRAWTAVLAAPLGPLTRLGSGTAWAVRGVRHRLLLRAARPRRSARRWPWLAPTLRAAALTAVVLVVFTPLLASADTRFASLLDGITGSTGAWLAHALSELFGAVLGSQPALVVGRIVVFGVAAVAICAALRTTWDAARDAAHRSAAPLTGPARARRPRPALTRRVEWLLPLAALDALFAVFLLVRLTAPDVAQTPGATLAGQVHAGFAQLVIATALVLAVVALAVRWTPMTVGPRAALALLCVLSLGLDAAALADLSAYVDAYGLTRLRVGVAVICAGLAALLVLLLVAGARWQRRRRQPWVPHAAVTVAAACLLGLTLADPDAAIARAQLARPDADVWYLTTLSADAAPAVADALHTRPDALGRFGPCVLAHLTGSIGTAQDDDEGWPSANVARTRAAHLASTAASAAPCGAADGTSLTTSR
ncbi:protein of unknown function [Quadrisphaera granulorum]|uniref:Uncharacterized protein DUF4173 n=1 Tax=Quadrisphaera granulorum TaxID=317664 RepID=A0A315ZR21_9ACTN|nr:DUF4153 domain-containing protein [Quadrisphaera granulorum]PWJ47124.1 uncharacterized protein DUF4173 [Quadrisphaera granulorum]SZE98928.1 protein of unknown function [Quadrisphaera granulorum]